MTRTTWLKQLGLLLILCGCAEAAEQIRCALVVDNDAELRSSAMVSLLEARLSQDNRLQLLERGQIDTILREQQMSLTVAAEPNAAMRVGRLLRADAFVLLSAEGSNVNLQNAAPSVGTVPMPDGGPRPVGRLLRVRVVESAHGFRLLDRYEQLDESDVGAAAGRIAERVRQVVQKVGQPVGQVIPVGIVDIHRVQLPDRYERLARVLPGLLSARLSAEPRILMLERENLSTLLKEKQLTDGNETAFWNSTVLVDGHIQPDPNGGIQMSLRLRSSGGTELKSFAVSVDQNAPVVAIDETAVQISQAIMKSSLSSPWDAGKEAEEFYRQGVMLCNHQRFNEATPPLETARALQPDNVYYTASLFDNEWRKRGYNPANMGNPNGGSGGSDLELAELASSLIRQIRRDLDGGRVSPRYVYDHWARLLGMDILWSRYFARPESASTEEVRGINCVNRKIWLETMKKVLASGAVTDNLSMLRANLAWIASDDPNEVIANLRAALKEVGIPPDGNRPAELSEERAVVFDQAVLGVMSELAAGLLPRAQTRGQDSRAQFAELLKDRGFGQTHLRGNGDQLARLLKDYMKELSAADDPLTRFGSCMAMAQIDWNGNASEHAEAEASLRKAMVPLQTLVGPASPLGAGTKQILSRRVRDVLEVPTYAFGPDPSEIIGRLKNLLDPLVNDKAVDLLVLLDPGRQFLGVPREPPVDYYDLLERISLALEPRQSEQRVAWALSRVRDRLEMLQRVYPKAGWKRRQSGIAATVLFDQRDNEPPLVAAGRDMKTWGPHEGVLWLAAGAWISKAKPTLCTVVGINMADKKVQAQWRGEIPSPQGLSVTGVAPLGGALYVSLNGGGVIEFPANLLSESRSEERPNILSQEDGLPSAYISSVASDGKRLWLAYGREGSLGGEHESGLGSYDPRTRRWEPVFCSTLKGEPPFNSSLPYRIPALVFVPPDTIYFTSFFPDFPADTSRWGGIWRLDIASRHAEYIEKYRGGVLMSLGFDGAQVWCKGPFVLSRFDPDTRKGAFILGQRGSMTESSATSGQEIQWCRDLFIPEGRSDEIPYNAASLDLSTAAVHRNQLWVRFGTSQIAILKRGRPFEEAKIIPNDILHGDPAEQFLSTPYGIVAVGSGRVGLVETPGAIEDAAKEK